MVHFDIGGKPRVSFALDNVRIVKASGGVPYDGDYTVTPKIYEATVLPTKEKTMREDVTVLKIPQFEVSNESGGITLIMGNEYMEGN